MKRNVRRFVSFSAAAGLVQLVCVQAAAADSTQAQQEILDAAPFSIQNFASAPLDTLASLLTQTFAPQAELLYVSYRSLFLFLLLGAVLTILLVKTEWVSLLELLVAGGSFLLIADAITGLAGDFATSAGQWNTFLLGFIPVFATAVASSGETVAASLYSGFFLVALSAFAQGLAFFLVPVIECYLALCVTSAFWIGDELPDACKTAGKLLKKIVSMAGVLFTFIFGIQRVFSAAADGVIIQAGKAIGSTIPIIGQSVTSTASTFLAGMQVVKTGLGFAAIAVIATSFLPLYLTAFFHLILLSLAAFFCKLFSLVRCGKLFDCLAIGMEAMMAVVALFFFMVSIGTALMLVIGAGG